MKLPDSTNDTLRPNSPEEAYQALAAALDEGYCVVEAVQGADGTPDDLRFVESNASFGRLVGLATPERLAGRTLRELGLDFGPVTPLAVEQVAFTGETFTDKTSISGVPFKVKAFRIGDKERLRVGLLFAGTEAQEVQRVEAEQLQTFDTVLGQLQEFVYLFDREGRFRYVNKPLLDLWGLTLEGAVGKTFFDLGYPVEIAEMLHREIRQTIQTRTAVEGETEYTSPAGDTGYYEYTFVPLFAADGSVESVGGHTRVVTEQREREAELSRLMSESERQRRLYETVLSNTPDLVYVWGLDHRFVYANASLLGMWSRTWDEAIGKHCLELGYEPWHAEMHDREIDQVVATKRPVRGVVPFDGAYGRRMYDYILVPVIGEDGQVEAVAGTTRDVTDLVEVENALRESEERLRTALVAGRMAHWTWNPNTDRMVASDTMGDLFGLTEGEVWQSSQQGFGMVHPEDEARHRALVEESRRRGEGWHTEFRIIRPRDGSTAWLEERAHVTRHPKTGEEAITGLVWDVSSRKVAELALRESEARLRRALSIQTVGVLFFKLDGTIIDANAAFEGMSGWSLDELRTTAHWEELTAPDYREATLRTAQALAERGETSPYEKELVRPDGSRWWGLFAPTRLAGSGTESLCVEFIVDITERKQAEEALRESEELFRTVFDEAKDDAILLMDEGRCLLAWNAAAERICGWSAAEAVGQSGDLIFTAEDRVAGVPEEEAQVTTQADKAVNERWHVKKDGTLFWGSGTMNALRNPDGTVRGFLKVFRDATTRYEMERRIQEMNSELERMVAERTQALQEAVREAEGFNYSIAHDLRAPLRAIVSTASILVEEAGPELSPEHQDMLARQSYNAKRLGTLIDELLRLSRLARAEVRREPLNITRKAREVVAAEAVDCSHRVEVQEGMTALGDPDLVRMLLHNLIGNACKFSPQGGTVRVGQTDGVFWVRDEGVGFDMKYAEKIFRPFERLVTEAEFEGTGIGLANVERIVKRHGGRIWAESEPGRGATFFFTLGA